MATLLMTLAAQGQAAKPSPYEGVSRPPANESILANDDASANPPAAKTPAHASTTVASNVTPRANMVPTFAVRPVRPPSDSNAQIVTNVLSSPNQLPEGTILKVLLDQQLSTATTQAGSMFSARMMENVTKDGRVVIPMGATVVGRVLSVSEGRRFRGQASIRLRPDEIDLPGGSRFFLHAEVYDMSARKGNKTDSEGDIVSKDNGKKTIAMGAASAGGSAATGAMIAGVPGAIVGAALGAGLVTAHWLMENHQAVLPKNSEVVFGLTEPMSLVPLHD
ncbi:MAG TPA: hypothetical protein VMU62_09485 [Acidobacteriaceae bacterium]|nr:hypothetical protein [Acidobacteriaceae bacterium]